MESTVVSKRFIMGDIPALIWGNPQSDKVYIYVHGKDGYKECAVHFAEFADKKGYCTLSFDLPGHGERKGVERCDIWSGRRDLAVVAEYAFSNWKSVSLFGLSLGAYFSVNTYNDFLFDKVLFQSPVLNMEYLVKKAFEWFDVTEELLYEKQEIETSLDILTWKYYRYILEHPVLKWDSPTAILYGAKDNLQSREVLESFSEKFGCRLTVAEKSDHPFMDEGDREIVEKWMSDNI